MFKNYLKIAIRRIHRHKMNSAINIIGISVGIAASVIIYLYAHNELTFDQFHENANRIHLIYKERITPAGTQITRDTWLPMAEALKNEYPAIENVVRIWDSEEWVDVGNRKFEEEITYADPELFDVFTFPLAEGNRQSIFSDIHSAVISQDIARKFFGDADPIGKRIRIAFETDYTIRGVLAEIPQNSSIEIDILVSPRGAPFYERNANNWGRSWLFTFLQLRPDASAAELEAQFPSFVAKIWGEEENQRTNFRLLQLTDLHHHLTSARTDAYILLGIAFIILAIASINFVNLATARSMERSREIGIRKVMGAERGRLIWQFLNESVLISLLALLLGVLLVELTLPYFNSLYDLSLDLAYSENIFTLLTLFSLAITVGFVAGIYPAIHLSRLQPADSMRGQLKNIASGTKLRLGLVVAQFALSIILVVVTGVLWKQMQFMKSASLNFDKENVLAVDVSQNDFADAEDAKRTLESFKNEIRQHSSVQSVSSSSHIPGRWPGTFVFVFPVEQGEQRRMRMRWCAVDANFFETFGMTFREGRSFSEDLPAEAEQSVVINEAALRDFGWSSAEGHQIRVGDTKFDVLGVVKDYHYDSLVEEIAPVIHFFQPSDSRRHRVISIKLAAGNIPAALDFIQEKWRQQMPENPFNFYFVDDNFNQLYKGKERLMKVVSVFAGLATVIAALGLFALSLLMIVQRTKEIGIRKVLGASVANVVALQSKDFVKLVLVSNLFAWPVAWLAMNRWLQNFAYRIDIGWWVFALAGGLALLIALLTVSTQAVRAALANPVESLRYE